MAQSLPLFAQLFAYFHREYEIITTGNLQGAEKMYAEKMHLMSEFELEIARLERDYGSALSSPYADDIHALVKISKRNHAALEGALEALKIITQMLEQGNKKMSTMGIYKSDGSHYNETQQEATLLGSC